MRRPTTRPLPKTAITSVEEELLAARKKSTRGGAVLNQGRGSKVPDWLIVNYPHTAGRIFYSDASGYLATEAGLQWDYTNKRVGVLGAGAVSTVPGYPFHVEDSQASAGTLGYFKNVSAANTASAQVVVEADTSGAYGALVQYGSTYADVAAFAGHAAVYSGLSSSGLIALSLAGPIEFWLYQGAYPSGSYTHVADMTASGSDTGLHPGADSTFYLGSETGPLRWADISVDAAHINSYAVTCEGTTVIGQDYSTDGTPQFGQVTVTTGFIGPQIGPSGDADLLGLGANVLTLNGGIRFSPSTFTIRADTSDASDTKYAALTGGGALGATRGAFMRAYGNEGSTNSKGRAQIQAGTVATSGTYDGMITFAVAGSVVGRFDRSGNLVLGANLMVGTYAAKGAEAFAGYITIKDSGGTDRKVMVCA